MLYYHHWLWFTLELQSASPLTSLKVWPCVSASCAGYHSVLVCAAKPGQWSSGEEGVISLDADSGVAVAVATGRALVYHNVDGLVDTHTEVSSNCVYQCGQCYTVVSSRYQ